MNSDVYSVRFDASTGFWHWTRTPHGDPAAVKFTSTEKFGSISQAVEAAETIAAHSGIFSLPFDNGKGGEKSTERFGILMHQINKAETFDELEKATQALFNYDLTMYHCANHTVVAYKRREIAVNMDKLVITLELREFAVAA